MLVLDRPIIMRGKPKNPSVTAVGRWIDNYMEMCSIGSLRELAEISGVSQPRITQMRKGDTTTRDMILRLAPYLTPPGIAEKTVTEEGLDAAARDQFSHENSDDHEVVDFVRGMPETRQDKALRMLKAALTTNCVMP